MNDTELQTPDTPAPRPAVEIWTDGACAGNPGPGGWAAILCQDSEERMLTGSAPWTTNSRMELTAALEALKALPHPSRVTVRSDSQYLVRGMNEWMGNWLLRGWRTAGGKPVENRDLWEALMRASAHQLVTWVWVKGHAADPMNRRVDRMAVAACNRQA
ncbi:ribonuclease HI [Roseomonas gilardii subsp. gilardii]|uniref:ribonuclease HI n=1 Tax=Roseomonas gilardii TaxID=257708 RepID=UPI001FFA3415|nr:ribonuclease HI [Roseomonas gilardii]UPG71624.1 ribonuclease HI [Roseomonas gilardii subsp. gilardii]